MIVEGLCILGVLSTQGVVRCDYRLDRNEPAVLGKRLDPLTFPPNMPYALYPMILFRKYAKCSVDLFVSFNAKTD
jgi:hypothetical protein